MPLFRRSDGTLLTKLSMFRKLNPVPMRNRTEAQIFMPVQFDITHTMQYIENFNKSHDFKINLFDVILSSIIRAMILRPQLNRFVVGHNIYQRNHLFFSFIANKLMSEEGEEANVKLECFPDDTIFTIHERLRGEVSIAKSEEGNESDNEVKQLAKLPFPIVRFLTMAFRWLDSHNLGPKSQIDSDPLYASCYIANIGRIKAPAPFHHLFSWGTASLFFGIGEKYKAPKVNEKNEIVVREVVDFIVTYDDRIADGMYGAKAIKIVKNLAENPEQLEKPVDITPELLAELKLKNPTNEKAKKKKTE